MSHNSLSEGFIQFTYSGITKPHHAVLPVNYVGTPTPGIMPELTTKGGGSVTAEAGLDDYIIEFRKGFNTGTIFSLAEAYSVNPSTEERTFLYAWGIGANGASADPNVQYAMYTMTFKTFAGGTLRVVAMESNLTVNQVVDPPFADFTFLADLSSYVVSDDSILIGRDNGVAFAARRVKSKTSDALLKAGGY